ncbi:hypothetical protein RJT34_14143 [Clitoria ternatea]|uniref:Uncharacterized protein n=1 Tax=Clitoria ternatea TaxID=43366 RepID=A0AAN9JSD6_CLITE
MSVTATNAVGALPRTPIFPSFSHFIKIFVCFYKNSKFSEIFDFWPSPQILQICQIIFSSNTTTQIHPFLSILRTL